LAASALCLALLTGPGHAQVSAASSATSASAAPLHSLGFMPPYEIARKVRRAGFDPLSPPLREGSIYVVRATDFRGILMRVVIDARSGVIRDASRIVPGPGSYGQQAAMLPYEPLPNETPGLAQMSAYGRPDDYEAPPVPREDGEMMPPRAPALHPVTRASVTVLPPLPRPRPSELAARKQDDAKSDAKIDVKSDAKSDAKADAKADAKSDVKPATAANPPAKPEPKAEVTGSAAAPPASSLPPATAAAKPSKSLEPPPIND
jgi:hypothetical protein